MRGTRSDSEPLSGRLAARLCWARVIAQLSHHGEVCTSSLQSILQRSNEIRGLALASPIGMSPVSVSSASVPVFCINLDRSPHRLHDMFTEFKRVGVRGCRLPAIDGRHRVVQWSPANPYHQQL